MTASENMKIYLQNKQTKTYFCLPGIWTPNINFAFNFRHSERAQEYARQNDLTDVQVVVKFEDERLSALPSPVPVGAIA
jgi:hypothetical protein